MQEVWKDIYFIENGVEYDYRGLYQVSNYGNIKSFHNGKEKIKKKTKSNNGYQIVNLCKNGKQKKFLVHRLVLYVFDSDNYFDGADVDHINTDRTDNRFKNLHWCTRKENCNNPLTKDNCSKAKKDKTLSEEHKHKISEAMKGKNIGKLIERWSKDGILIDIKYQFEYVEMGFNKGNIYSCCKGKCKSAGGYIFKYHEELE